MCNYKGELELALRKSQNCCSFERKTILKHFIQSLGYLFLITLSHQLRGLWSIAALSQPCNDKILAPEWIKHDINLQEKSLAVYTSHSFIFPPPVPTADSLVPGRTHTVTLLLVAAPLDTLAPLTTVLSEHSSLAWNGTVGASPPSQRQEH